MRKTKLRDLAVLTQDVGCGLLTVLFISLPIWVLSISWRGPVFAIGALLVLLALVFGVALLSRFLERH